MIKPLVISIVLILISNCCFSQTEKNNLFVGGGANFKTGNIITNSDAKGFEINVTPKIGYFVIRKLAIGLNANIGYFNYSKNASSGSNFSVGSLARYYFTINKQALIIELSYNYGQSKDSSTFHFTNPNQTIVLTNRNKFNQYSIGGGYAYFVKENVSIEAMYQFQIIDEKYLNNYGYSTNSTKRKNRSNINIGLLFYF